MIRPIAIGLSPNVSSSDALLALRTLLSPWSYKKGKSITRLEQWFARYFKVPYAVSFTSGRGSLFAILKSLEIGQEDEVIMQAFTCVAVSQAIIATGAKPIYADIDKSLTLSPISLEKNISKKTKAIIVQHTFGIGANMEVLQKIAKKHKLFLIEDVAHAIGGTYKGQKLGTFGVASIFSFGRDKAFSSVSGGIAITRDKKLGESLERFNDKNYPSVLWIVQNLLHPILFSFLILPLYDRAKIGKAILIVLQKLHILSLPVDRKYTILSQEYVQKMPNALAELVYQQLRNIDKVNSKRQKIAAYYQENLSHFEQPVIDTSIPFLRYPILYKDAFSLLQRLRKQHIYLGNWYAHVIDPKWVNLSKVGYTIGSCPNAEKIAKKIINLPTYPTLTEQQMKKVVDSITMYEAN